MAKTVSWHTTATITTMLLFYAFTARTDCALTVGSVNAIAKTALYYFHERMWNQLTPGPTPVASRTIGRRNLS